MIIESQKDNNIVYNVIVEPSSEPVTVDELKEFARIDGSDEDTLLESLIKAVRQAMELYLNRTLITTQYKLLMDYWPGWEVGLPMPPLQSISSVKLLDEDGTETDYDSDNYFVVTESIPGQLILKNSVSPPFNSNRYKFGYEIKFLAGYGDDSTDVPDAILNAIKQWCTMIYESRAEITEPPEQIKASLSLYRVLNI